MKFRRLVLFVAAFAFVPLLPSCQSSDKSVDPVAALRRGVAAGSICFRLTEPDEIKALLGPPQEEKESPDGGMVFLRMTYPGLSLGFGKMKDEAGPHTLRFAAAGEERLDIGQDRKIVLRTEADLAKTDRFAGLQNTSLVRLDLRSRAGVLDASSFDTLTEWPAKDKLPPGFDPAALLDLHKTPGLGIRGLHRSGIDGRGVGAAVIDQPLLLGHREYADRIVRYDRSGLLDFPPQYHASPVASILAGREIGVAPGVDLSYFAVPMWESDNLVYVRALRKILTLNGIVPPNERIRTVSISDGAFRGQAHYQEWTEILAEAEKLGVLVVTCDPAAFKYGILSAVRGRDPEDPSNYRPGRYIGKDDVLRVPAGNRTLASHRDAGVYWFDPDGGMSWGAPYIAGLAALAFQVRPEIEPKKILELLAATVTSGAAGPVVNPSAFIEAVRKSAAPVPKK